MMSHVKVRSSTTYHILLAEFGEIPHRSMYFKLPWVFNNGLLTYPPLG